MAFGRSPVASESMEGFDQQHDRRPVTPGPCFHTIAFNGCAMSHCPQTAAWHGRFQDGTGRWFDVDACAEHAGVLIDRQRTGPD
jgi:hypothetical protein